MENYILKFVDSVRNFSIFHSNTGLGTNADNSKNVTINTSIPSISEREANSLFIHAGILQRIIDLYPDLAALLELEITSTADIDEQLITDRIEELELQSLFVDATKSARLFKEAYLILDINDGMQYSEPVDVERSQGLNGVYFLEFGSLKPIWNANRTKRIGYKFNTNNVNTQSMHVRAKSEIQIVQQDLDEDTVIDASRVLLFHGKKLTPKQQQLNNGYHASMIDGLIPSYSTIEVAHNHITNMVSRALTFLFKMKGLNKFQDAGIGHIDAIRSRLALAKQTIGTLGGILLDLDSEEIEPMQISLAGLSDTLNSANKFFTAQTPLSHDQLWNEGSHSTSSDLEDKNTISAVKAFIKTHWVQNWNRATVHIAKEFTPERVVVSFKVPSFDMTVQEELTVKQTQAAIDQIYSNLGVLSPQIIQGNRFMQNSLQTNLNVKSDIDIVRPEDLTDPNNPNEVQSKNGQKTKDKAKDKKDSDTKAKVKDASYESSNDYQITIADIKETFKEVKNESPLLFAILDADIEPEQ